MLHSCSWYVCSLSVYIFVYIDIAYGVEIVPVQTSQILYLGNTGHFNCTVSPNPVNFYQSVQLRYIWTINGVSSRTTTLSNNSLYIDSRYTKHTYLFCKVQANLYTLGTGQYLIEVKGKQSVRLCCNY